MKNSWLIGTVITVCAVIFSSRVASAEPKWDTDIRIYSDTRIVGYRPGVIIEGSGSRKPFDAQSAYSANTFAGVRLQLNTDYLELYAHPYTLVPNERARVSVAGLELHLQVPVTDWLRLGLYHHSAHNFAEEDYGFGINLNGASVEVRPYEEWHTSPVLGLFRQRAMVGTQVYLPGSMGNAPAYAVSPRAHLAKNAAGYSRWKLYTQLNGDSTVFHYDIAIDLLAERDKPSSMTLSMTAQPSLSFLGGVGGHFLIGPTYSAGGNLSRWGDYGPGSIWFGLRLDILMSDPSPH